MQYVLFAKKDFLTKILQRLKEHELKQIFQYSYYGYISYYTFYFHE